MKRRSSSIVDWLSTGAEYASRKAGIARAFEEFNRGLIAMAPSHVSFDFAVYRGGTAAKFVLRETPRYFVGRHAP
jgi:hypothetical protein